MLASWLEIEKPASEIHAGELHPVDAAYADLAHGRLVLPPVGNGVQRVDVARLTRLVAASDGASPELVQSALALPLKEGLDGDTVWAALGLALRAHADLAALQDALTDPALVASSSSPAKLRRMWALVVASARPDARALSAADLRGLDPEERGHVYTALAVALEQKAPPAYRLKANRLLFAYERPSLRIASNQQGAKS
jgi:hypothetical protein